MPKIKKDEVKSKDRLRKSLKRIPPPPPAATATAITTARPPPPPPPPPAATATAIATAHPPPPPPPPEEEDEEEQQQQAEDNNNVDNEEEEVDEDDEDDEAHQLRLRKAAAAAIAELSDDDVTEDDDTGALPLPPPSPPLPPVESMDEPPEPPEMVLDTALDSTRRCPPRTAVDVDVCKRLKPVSDIERNRRERAIDSGRPLLASRWATSRTPAPTTITPAATTAAATTPYSYYNDFASYVMDDTNNSSRHRQQQQQQQQQPTTWTPLAGPSEAELSAVESERKLNETNARINAILERLQNVSLHRQEVDAKATVRSRDEEIKLTQEQRAMEESKKEAKKRNQQQRLHEESPHKNAAPECVDLLDSDDGDDGRVSDAEFEEASKSAQESGRTRRGRANRRWASQRPLSEKLASLRAVYPLVPSSAPANDARGVGAAPAPAADVAPSAVAVIDADDDAAAEAKAAKAGAGAAAQVGGTAAAPPGDAAAAGATTPSRGGRVNVELSGADLAYLERGEFLNDTVIDWRVLRVKLEDLAEQPDVLRRCHFFNSFFYKKLNPYHGESKRRRYDDSQRPKIMDDAVRRWVKDLNLMEKDFIFVPIHHRQHWSLAVICFPRHVMTNVDERPGTQTPCILHFDSVAGGHETDHVVDALRRFCFFEYKREFYTKSNLTLTEKNTHLNDAEKWFQANKRFPGERAVRNSYARQQNHYDCGLFVIEYIRQLTQSHLAVLDTKLTDIQQYFDTAWFDRRRPNLLRSEMYADLLAILVQQNGGEHALEKYDHERTEMQQIVKEAAEARNQDLQASMSRDVRKLDGKIAVLAEAIDLEKTWREKVGKLQEQHRKSRQKQAAAASAVAVDLTGAASLSPAAKKLRRSSSPAEDAQAMAAEVPTWKSEAGAYIAIATEQRNHGNGHLLCDYELQRAQKIKHNEFIMRQLIPGIDLIAAAEQPKAKKPRVAREVNRNEPKHAGRRVEALWSNEPFGHVNAEVHSGHLVDYDPASDTYSLLYEDGDIDEGIFMSQHEKQISVKEAVVEKRLKKLGQSSNESRISATEVDTIHPKIRSLKKQLEQIKDDRAEQRKITRYRFTVPIEKIQPYTRSCKPEPLIITKDPGMVGLELFDVNRQGGVVKEYVQHLPSLIPEKLRNAIQTNLRNLPWRQCWHKVKGTYRPHGRLQFLTCFSEANCAYFLGDKANDPEKHCALGGLSTLGTPSLDHDSLSPIKEVVNAVLHSWIGKKYKLNQARKRITVQVNRYLGEETVGETKKAAQGIPMHADGAAMDPDFPIIHLYILDDAIVRVVKRSDVGGSACRAKTREGVGHSKTIHAHAGSATILIDDSATFHGRSPCKKVSPCGSISMVLRVMDDVNARRCARGAASRLQQHGSPLYTNDDPTLELPRRIHFSYVCAPQDGNQVTADALKIMQFNEDVGCKLFADESAGDVRMAKRRGRWQPPLVFESRSAPELLGLEPHMYSSIVKGKGSVVSSIYLRDASLEMENASPCTAQKLRTRNSPLPRILIRSQYGDGGRRISNNTTWMERALKSRQKVRLFADVSCEDNQARYAYIADGRVVHRKSESYEWHIEFCDYDGLRDVLVRVRLKGYGVLT
ncbi:sentrin-specific protease [Pseudoscourfieldia marina]